MSEEKKTTTWWRYGWGKVVPVEVTKETAECVWVLNAYSGKPRRNNKRSEYESYFRTKRGAIQYGLDKWSWSLNEALEAVKDAKAMIAEFEAMLKECGDE